MNRTGSQVGYAFSVVSSCHHVVGLHDFLIITLSEITKFTIDTKTIHPSLVSNNKFKYNRRREMKQVRGIST